MPKLVLFSDLIDGRNDEINSRLLNLFTTVDPSIGYIPSCSDKERRYFQSTLNYYNNIGIDRIDYFDLDLEYNQQTIGDIFNYDAIHLSGGNTFYFLHLLKKRNFINLLNQYVMCGGILIGVSAGSILTTKNIDIAGFGEESDENIVGIKDTRALGLVEFEFMPHWDGSMEVIRSLENYARDRTTVVYAVRDGSGIVVDNNIVEMIGEIYMINSNNEV